MNIELIKDELKKFNKYKFYEEPHKYTYTDELGNEKEIGISVTTLIDKYIEPFDREKVATKKALKENISKEELLKKWDDENTFSCIKGTYIHLYNEYLWKNKSFSCDNDIIKPIWNKLKKICDSFYNKFKDNLIPIGLEQVIGSTNYDIAGSIDFLAYSKKLDSLIIIDYKTNKEIKTKSFNDKKMLTPLDKVPDSNYYHYSLQLALYKYILEYETSLKVNSKKWLVWINENNNDFVLYECANLDKEAKEILEKRKK